MAQPNSYYIATAAAVVLPVWAAVVAFLALHYRPFGAAGTKEDADRHKTNERFGWWIAIATGLAIIAFPIFIGFLRADDGADEGSETTAANSIKTCRRFIQDYPLDADCPERAYRDNPKCVIPGHFQSVTNDYRQALGLYCKLLEARALTNENRDAAF